MGEMGCAQALGVLFLAGVAVVPALSARRITTDLPTATQPLPEAGWDLVRFSAEDDRGDGPPRCLDGSFGGFYWQPGVATGVVVHLEGGGWCYNEALCLARAGTAIGSSSGWPATGVPLMDGGANGILSSDPAQNPDFANWTKFHLNYCDGGSFAGRGTGVSSGRPLHFGGSAILDSFIHVLLHGVPAHANNSRAFPGLIAAIADAGRRGARGPNPMANLVVGGTSAGGLATYLHLDRFRARMPEAVKVVGLPDAGFFLDVAAFSGQDVYPAEMRYVAEMMNVSAGVDQSCVAAHTASDSWKCLFAEYTLPHISTPMFVLQSGYDAWQMANVLDLPCYGDVKSCSPAERKAFDGFRATIVDRLVKPVQANPSFGAWVDSCVLHGQEDVHGDWDRLTINGTTARRAFGDWFFTRGNGSRLLVDCPWPCCNN